MVGEALAGFGKNQSGIAELIIADMFGQKENTPVGCSKPLVSPTLSRPDGVGRARKSDLFSILVRHGQRKGY
jgi:hypothetical protein